MIGRPTIRPKSVDGLAARFGATLLGNGQEPILGITHDSRAVKPGDVYAALPGANTHGANFAAQAMAQGATAVLTDSTGVGIVTSDESQTIPIVTIEAVRHRLGEICAWVYDNPTDRLHMVGVTGTNGKTTISSFVYDILNGCGVPTGILGTIHNRFSGTDFGASRTTPEATDLQAILASMADLGAQAVVMEVSSHAIVLERVGGITFDVSVFSNLSHDHLDFHGDMESYFEAKARLFSAGTSRRALVCVDDSWGVSLATRTSIPTATYSGGSNTADWTATLAQESGTGSRFTINGPTGSWPALCLLPGAFNRANAVAAVAVAAELGIETAEAISSLGASHGIPGRMQRVRVPRPAVDRTVFVDYAHTPEAVERVLTVGREIAAAQGGRVVAVIGCGGDRDQDKRSPMGAVAIQLADRVVVTDDNPRSEDPALIRAAIVAGARQADAAGVADRLCEVGDRREAIKCAVLEASAADVVLVLGKGHETTQEIGGIMTGFSDTDEVSRVLGGDVDD